MRFEEKDYDYKNEMASPTATQTISPLLINAGVDEQNRLWDITHCRIGLSERLTCPRLSGITFQDAKQRHNMEFKDHNDVKDYVKRGKTQKIFRLCERFNILPVKTLNMALDVGLSKIDEDLRHNGGKRYFKKLSDGGVK